MKEKISIKEREYVLVGSSKAIQDLRQIILKIAPTDSPVLVTGESGTGKELVARLIHGHSSRSRGPFVTLNLAAIPFELLEAELVGYSRGAFSGATKNRAGMFELANGGSVYLDELHEAPIKIQTLIMRVIDSATVRRLGENVERKVNVRLIASSRSEYLELARSSGIRLDLLRRLSNIRVPPLRERQEDIEELAEHFRKLYCAEFSKDLELDKSAIEALRKYDYPGNVRELQNIIERAVVLSTGRKISAGDLSLPSPLKPAPQPDQTFVKLELENTRRELDYIRRNSIPASPIWEGRDFPIESDYCFVLMPLSDTADVQKVYRDHVKPVLEQQCGLRCERADDIYDISGVMQSVWEGINRSRLIVADLTGRNANVFYELGIAHTLGKPVIILTQSMNFVPFDLRHLRCIVYEYKPATIRRLEQALEKTVKRILSSTTRSPGQRTIIE